MTRVSLLAELLYDMGIGLKRFDPAKLARKKYRQECIHDISAMQFLVHCIGMKHISDEDASKIIHVLDAYRHPRLQNYGEALVDADKEADYSDEYNDLLFKMASILSCIICELTNRPANYRISVYRYIGAFHNLPRAFLSISNGMRISAQDALEYSKSYLKEDTIYN